MVEEENIPKDTEDEDKVDSEDVGTSALSSEEGRNEVVETSALSSKEAKDLAESLLKEGYATNVVADKTGLSAPVVRGLKGSLVKKSKKLKEETKEKPEKKQPLSPYEEVESADEFLRNFLTEFEFNERFVELLCRKVKRRNALPHPNDLARDIRTMPSGITNPNSADYIADEYSYDLKDYLKRLESTSKPRSSMGYDVRHESHNTDHGGFPIHDRRLESDRGVPLWDRDEDNIPIRDVRRDREDRGRGRKELDMDQPLTRKDLMMLQLQEENRRLKEGNGRNNPGGEQSWMRERLIRLEDDLRQRDAERMQRLEDELKEARNIPIAVPQGPSGPSSEEIRQIIEREIDAQTKKLTSDDVERIVQRAIGGYQPGALTKHDLLYLEAKDKLHLEEKKLDESGKTRDVIADGIRDGFGHAGRIVSRMMTEEGGTTGMPMDGHTDQTGNMIQLACPKTLGGCGTIITAPIGSPTVVCPGCGRRWTVEPQEPAKQKIEPTTPAPKTEPTTATPPKQTTDASKDIEKIAEDIAIGEGVKKLEEELKKKKEKELEELRRHEEENERKRESASAETQRKKPWPTIDSDICPICDKKCKGKRGVGMHITEMHPEYKK